MSLSEMSAEMRAAFEQAHARLSAAVSPDDRRSRLSEVNAPFMLHLDGKSLVTERIIWIDWAPRKIGGVKAPAALVHLDNERSVAINARQAEQLKALLGVK